MNLIDEAASGFGKADAARIAVEEGDAQVFLQRFDPCADARLTGAERQSGAMEAEIFRDSERLRVLTTKPLRAGDEERAANPPSRSARLRVAELSEAAA